MIEPLTYTSLPITVQAIQMTIDNFREIGEWIYNLSGGSSHANVYTSIHHPFGYVTMEIDTRQGRTQATSERYVNKELVPGDWIVRDLETNEFYPCANDVFQRKYKHFDTAYQQ